MMAPYAIAHMKIGLKLAETGYRFGTEERARIYLTNALEPKVQQLPLIGFDALAHEAARAEIRRFSSPGRRPVPTHSSISWLLAISPNSSANIMRFMNGGMHPRSFKPTLRRSIPICAMCSPASDLESAYYENRCN